MFSTVNNCQQPSTQIGDQHEIGTSSSRASIDKHRPFGIGRAGTGGTGSQAATSFGKLGAHLWMADWSLTSTALSGSDDADGAGFLFGLGGSVTFGNVEVRGEWERFADIGDLASTDEGDFDLLSIGILLNF